MTRCYLGLGSNLDSPERQLSMALKAIRLLPQSNIIKVARFYRSKAWGRKAQPHFANTVVVLNTNLRPQRLLYLCQQIELKQGRIRKVSNGARTIDIDILFYGNQTISSKYLTIPHPRIQERNFVVIPLLEVARQSPPLPLPLTLNYNERT